MRDNFDSLPENLPAPQDDGACDHLQSTKLPSLKLRTTNNRTVDIAELTQKPTVFFFYPRTGRPDESAPVGWDEIPGARGCTPQSCGYRDLYSEFKNLGVQVFGVSTQTTEFQQELVQRIKLPYEILSDSDFVLTKTLNLPTFTFESMRLLKRAAWFCEGGMIKKVFYPVFPPDENAITVLDWIKSNQPDSWIPQTFAQAELITERLILEPISEDHAQELYDLFSDPELHHFVPFEPISLEKQKERCTRWAKRRSPDGSEIWLNWAGREKNSRKVIAHFQGGVKKDSSASIGYLVAKDFQNKGVATEGLRAVFDYLRDHLEVKEVKAWSDTRNLASHKLAKKLGMTQVDVIHNADFFKGTSSDEFVFSKVLTS